MEILEGGGNLNRNQLDYLVLDKALIVESGVF